MGLLTLLLGIHLGACVSSRLPCSRARSPLASSAPSGMPWPELRAILDDSVPAFVLVDEDGRSVGSEMRIHMDVQAARAELELARRSDPRVSIQAVGLGFGLQATGRAPTSGAADASGAQLIASSASVERARALPSDVDDAEWREAPSVPLFFCFQLQQRDTSGGTGGTSGGRLVTPLFLSADDADVALARAEAAISRGEGADQPARLQLRSTSVAQMSRLIADGGVKDPRALKFVPCRQAVEFLQAAEAGDADGADLRSASEPELSDSDALRLATMLYNGNRVSRAAKDGGLFPM